MLQKLSYIGCFDGWYEILDNLCAEIEKIEGYENFIVCQIKEKFGQLRFQIFSINIDEYGERIKKNIANDEKIALKIRAVVSIAEKKAAKTCEVCGGEGTLRVGGWVKTLCQLHEDERVKRHIEEHEERLKEYKKD